MGTDYAQLAARYASMAPAEFEAIRRDDLTARAKAHYDRELARRSPKAFEQLQERLRVEGRAATRQREIDHAIGPKPRLDGWTELAIIVGLLGLAANAVSLMVNSVTPGGRARIIPSASLSVAMVGLTAHMRAKRRWEQRRRLKEQDVRGRERSRGGEGA